MTKRFQVDAFGLKVGFFEFEHLFGGFLVGLLQEGEGFPLGFSHFGFVDFVVHDGLDQFSVVVVEVDGDVVVHLGGQEVVGVLEDLGQSDHGVHHLHFILHVVDLARQHSDVFLQLLRVFLELPHSLHFFLQRSSISGCDVCCDFDVL